MRGGSRINPGLLYATASTAEKRGGGKVGIPELWGRYNLKDVVNGYMTVNTGAVNPIQAVTGSLALATQDMPFKVSGKIDGAGLNLSAQHDLSFYGFALGVSLPIMNMRTSMRFSATGAPNDATARLYDKIRRQAHQDIGFAGNTWTKTGLGDLDAHLRWHMTRDHVLLMKKIDWTLITGLALPTGVTLDPKYPTAIPFGSNGHLGWYWGSHLLCELKQDWTLGMLMSFNHQAAHTRVQRISVDAEPAIFSSLVGKVKTEPGMTLKLSPYFTLGNITDGLDFQVRYTYLRHGTDKETDMRDDKSISSYFQKGDALIDQKSRLTKWRAHYVTISLLYDIASLGAKIKFAPQFFISYDMPINCSAFSQTHTVQLGAQLHF